MFTSNFGYTRTTACTMFRRIWLLFQFTWYVQAEYKCVCSYDGERPVFRNADKTSDVIGFLATNGCRQYVYPVDETWNAIVFMHQLGFIMSNTSIIHTCLSDPVDSLTTDGIKNTTHTTISTTSSTRTTLPTSTTTPRSSTTTTATTTTTRRSTTEPTGPNAHTSTASTVPEGHTELCPDLVKYTVNTYGGFLGQYSDYCFELINSTTQRHNAQRHCKGSGGGYLAHVTNQTEQDYIVRFLDKHHFVEPIWLGLTDATQEGHWTWMSGDPVTYTNFENDYKHNSQAVHNYNDCVIMEQGGEWTDVPCGNEFQSGSMGERHPFICQYNLTSKPPEIFHHQSGFLID